MFVLSQTREYSNFRIFGTTACTQTKFCSLHSDKLILFVGGPNMFNKWKLADGHHLEKVEKLQYLSNHLADFNVI